MLTKLQRFLPQRLKEFWGDALEDRSAFFRFGMDYWHSLFPREEYPEIAVCDAQEDLSGHRGPNGRNVLIMVNSVEDGKTPTAPHRSRDKLDIDGNQYEARVILCLNDHDEPKNPGAFDGIRYVRHGRGFHKWRRQLRSANAHQLMTDCISGEPYSEMDQPDSLEDIFAYITVYVLAEPLSNEDRRVDFHRSLGGQARVVCACNRYPLIATGRRKEN